MSDDLAKRLRDAAYRAKREYPEVFRVSEEIAYEAADRIEKLEAEVSTARRTSKYWKMEHLEGNKRIEQLEAVLRDVLLWGDHCEACDYDDDWAKIEVRACKALEGKDD